MADASDYFLANCKFNYRCTKTWESLDTTEEHDIRFCKDCQELVTYCNSKREIVTALRKNKCIAIYMSDSFSESTLLGQIIAKRL
jgi:hypothetical protein